MGIGESLGEVRMDLRSPEPIRDIRPQLIAEAKPNTLSSRYGMEMFPFHTDVAHWQTPARYVILYCEDPGSGDRPTLLQDTRKWDIRESEQRAFLREVWKTGHVRPYLCTVGKLIGERLALRYDDGCMRPMTRAAYKLQEQIINYIETCPVTSVHWTPGKMLVMDNHRIVHARGKAHCSDRDRIIKRILIGS